MLLSHALDSLLAQTLSPDRFDILIIDNGSTDNTCEVATAYQEFEPRLRYFLEPHPGIAHARNRAIQETHCEYLAFLDDDAWAEPQWLEELHKVLNTLPTAPACVVGPVLLEWEGARPDWFPVRFEPFLCRYDMGLVPRYLGADGYLLTTNVLFQCSSLLQLNGFRAYLGRTRGKMLGGEDNDIYQRLVQTGHSIFYQPTARVHHGVPKERQTRRYLLRRLFWDGASQPLLKLSQLSDPKSQYRPGREAYIDLRRCGRFVVDFFYYSLLGRFAQAQDSFLSLVQRLGRLRTHIALLLSWHR